MSDDKTIRQNSYGYASGAFRRLAGDDSHLSTDLSVFEDPPTQEEVVEDMVDNGWKRKDAEDAVEELWKREVEA